MSTFIQGNNDQFGPMQLYQPDFGFLQQVYNARQTEYNKGFNLMKSLYSSAMNNPLTNQDNQQRRYEIFGKMQNSIKSVANLDLSNPTNVIKAQQLLSPIVDDDDIAYDMAYTSQMNKQKQIMASYRDSMDPERRKQYNDFSKQLMQFSEENMRNAKRGDGSIRSVQAESFVPFQDVDEYLDKRAKEAGLEIKRDTLSGLYKVTEKGGDQAVMPYTQWAKSVLGNQFDAQFNVIGKVQTESAIRGLMRDKGVDRQSAINIIGGQYLEGVKKQYNSELDYTNKSLKDLDDNIRIAASANTKKGKQRLAQLQQTKDNFESHKTDLQTQLNQLATQGDSFNESSFYYLNSNNAKLNAAGTWAKNKAAAQHDISITPDQARIAQMQISSREKLAHEEMGLKYQMHLEDLELQKAKLMMSLHGKGAKGAGNGTGILEGDASIIDEGSYRGSDAEAGQTGVDVLQKTKQKASDDMYNTVFSAGGLMELAIPDMKNVASYKAAMNTVRQIAEGKTTYIGQDQVNAIKQLGEELGFTSDLSRMKISQARANYLIKNITSQVALRASELTKEYKASGNTKKIKESLDALRQYNNSLKDLTEGSKDIDKAFDNIADYIEQKKGSIEELNGLSVLGMTANGKPIYDISKLPDFLKSHLSAFVPSNINKQIYATGRQFAYQNVGLQEISAVVKQGLASGASIEGKGFNMQELERMTPADLVETFGNSMRVAYDPQHEEAVIKLAVNAKSKYAANKKMTEGSMVTIKMKYNSILNNTMALPNLKAGVKQFSLNYGLKGDIQNFIGNPNATTSSLSYQNNMGFTYNMVGDRDVSGNRGVTTSFRFQDPRTKDWYHKNIFTSVKDFDNPEELMQLQSLIHNFESNYMDSLIDDDNEYESENE